MPSFLSLPSHFSPSISLYLSILPFFCLSPSSLFSPVALPSLSPPSPPYNAPPSPIFLYLSLSLSLSLSRPSLAISLTISSHISPSLALSPMMSIFPFPLSTPLSLHPSPFHFSLSFLPSSYLPFYYLCLPSSYLLSISRSLLPFYLSAYYLLPPSPLPSSSSLYPPLSQPQNTLYKVANVHSMLQNVRAIVSPSISQKERSICQRRMNQSGLLNQLCSILMATGIPADVLTECINTVAEVIRGHPDNQVPSQNAPLLPPRGLIYKFSDVCL